jgi:rRNA-processing protein FCF1
MHQLGLAIVYNSDCVLVDVNLLLVSVQSPTSVTDGLHRIVQQAPFLCVRVTPARP